MREEGQSGADFAWALVFWNFRGGRRQGRKKTAQLFRAKKEENKETKKGRRKVSHKS